MKFWLYKFSEGRGDKDNAERAFRDLVANNPDSTLTWTLMERRASCYTADGLMGEFTRAVSEGGAQTISLPTRCFFLLVKDSGKRNARLGKMPSVERRPWEALERDMEKPRFRSRYSGNIKGLERYFAVGQIDGINRELSMLGGDPVARRTVRQPWRISVSVTALLFFTFQRPGDDARAENERKHRPHA